MLNVRLAGDYLNGKLLFTWLSLVMSLMVSFLAVLLPRDILVEIWHLIESVNVLRGFLPSLLLHVTNLNGDKRETGNIPRFPKFEEA